MANFELSENAKDDLKRIYFFGLERFGEAQADQYFLQLYEQFAVIAEQPLSYPSIDSIQRSYRKCPFQSDTIYYRINSGTVEIMAIIGQQDIEAWL